MFAIGTRMRKPFVCTGDELNVVGRGCAIFERLAALVTWWIRVQGLAINERGGELERKLSETTPVSDAESRTNETTYSRIVKFFP